MVRVLWQMRHDVWATIVIKNIFANCTESHLFTFFQLMLRLLLSPVSTWKEKTIFPKLMNGKSLTLKARPSNLCKNDHLSKEQKRKEIEYSSFIVYYIYQFKFHWVCFLLVDRHFLCFLLFVLHTKTKIWWNCYKN